MSGVLINGYRVFAGQDLIQSLLKSKIDWSLVRVGNVLYTNTNGQKSVKEIDHRTKRIYF